MLWLVSVTQCDICVLHVSHMTNDNSESIVHIFYGTSRTLIVILLEKFFYRSFLIINSILVNESFAQIEFEFPTR